MSAVATRLQKLVETDAHEGPVFVAAENALYFTTVPRPGPRTSIKRLELDTLRVTIVREDANMANGMALDLAGRLVICEQGGFDRPARIRRDDETLAGGLNSPNDVIVARDGSIWFTDPSYGFLQGFRPRPERPDAVYRLTLTKLQTVTSSPDKPNGLALSPDERTLYVGDSSERREVIAIDLPTGAERIFASDIPGHPDGIEVDADGRVYVSSADGVLIFDPDGIKTGEVPLPGAVNFTFGGPDGDVLYITTDDAIWAAHPNAKGTRP
jgi:gluconolactonase